MSSSQAGPRRYAGFQPIPILLPRPTSVPWKKSTKRYLWIRENRSSTKSSAPQDDLPNGRTLFVANLPIDAEESDLREVFGEYGSIEQVVFKVAEHGNATDPWAKPGVDNEDDSEDEDDSDVDEEDQQSDAEMTMAPSEAATSRRSRRKPRKAPLPPPVVPLPPLDPRSQPYLPSCSSCYLVYLDTLSLQRAIALAPTRSAKTLLRPNASPSGIAFYLAQHSSVRPPLDIIKSHADSSLALFDHHASVQSTRASKGAITDKDGFTLVVRGGRFGRTAGKGEKGVGVASRRFMLETKKVKGIEGAVVDAREGLLRGKVKKNSGAQLDGFYKFQRHEQKRQGESFRFHD